MKIKIIILSTLFTISAIFSIENSLNTIFNELVSKDTISKEKAILVLPFNIQSKKVDKSTGVTIAEYAVAFFSASPQYKVIERENFKTIANELALSQTGIIDENTAVRVGKIAAANILLTGSISDILGKQMILARFVNIETGEVISTASSTVTSKNLNSFYKNALGEKMNLSAYVLRSAIVPGWGQFYSDHPVKGAAFLGTTAISVGLLVNSFLNLGDKSDIVATFNQGTNVISGESGSDLNIRKRAAIEEENKAITSVNIYTALTAIVWTINILDAAFIGYKDSKKVRDLYFSIEPSIDFFHSETSFLINKAF